MFTSTAYLRALLGAIIGLFLVACNSQETSVPLRIGTNIWAGYEPLYLARSLNYFSEDKVRLVENSSTSQSIRLYLNGHLEAAALTLDEVLVLQQQGGKPCVVLVMDISDGADVIIAKPEITALADLRGKRVGVENTAVGAYTLTRALQLANINLNEIEVVSLEVAAHAQAFLAGEVDAVVTFEPVRTQLLSANANQIFDSSQIPNEIVDVLVVHQDYVQQYQAQVQYVLDNWFKSLDFLVGNPEQAASHMAPRMGIPETEVNSMYEGLVLPSRAQNRQLLGVEQAEVPLRETIRKLNQIMLAKKLLTQSVEVDNVCIYNQAL